LMCQVTGVDKTKQDKEVDVRHKEIGINTGYSD